MTHLTESQREAIFRLFSLRDSIEDKIVEIETILKTRFPEEYAVAYQHWIPQIKTALKDNLKWLPRGEYSMQYTLDRLIDVNDGKGVNKYI